MPSVSIVVPTLNEANNIDLLLEGIFSVQQKCGLDLEVVFTDGASTDETCEKIKRWQPTHPVQLVSHEVNKGLAEAVMDGARAARGEFVVVMDADLSHPCQAIPDLLEPLFSDTHDMVIGSRYVNGGDTPDWPLGRKLSSRLATLPARFFSDVKDPLAGFFAVRRERLANLSRSVCGFKIGLELLATAEEELRVTERPIIFHDRFYGVSKMSSGVIIDYLRQLLNLGGIRLFPESGKIGFFLVFLLGALTDYSLLYLFLQNEMSAGSAHIYSFSLAALMAGALSCWLYMKQTIASEKDRLVEYMEGCITVIFLTLFLRGGVLGTLLQQYSVLPPGSLVLVVLTGVCCSYCGCVYFVFPARRRRINGELVRRFYGLGVVAYLVVLRILYLGAFGLLDEEAYLLDQARQISAGDVHWPALPGLVTWLTTSIFGTAEVGVRLGAIICWLPAAIFVFSLARDMVDRTIAFRAVLLFSVLPYFMGAGIFMTADALLIVAWAGTLFYLHRALIVGIPSAWGWAGLLTGAGVLLDNAMLLLLPTVPVFMLCSESARSWLKRKEPYLAMLLIGGIVVLAHLTGGGSPVEQFQGKDWLENLLLLPVCHNLTGIIILLTPTALLAVAYCCLNDVVKARNSNKSVDVDGPMTYRFSLSMFGVPVLLGGMLNVVAGADIDYVGPVCLALLPCIAVTLFPRSGGQPGHSGPLLRVLYSLWWPTILLLLFLYGILLHYHTF